MAFLAYFFPEFTKSILRPRKVREVRSVFITLFHIRVSEKNGIPRDRLSSFLYGAVPGEDVTAIRGYANTDTMYIGGNKILQSVYHILLNDLMPISLDRAIADLAVVGGLQNIYSVHKRED